MYGTIMVRTCDTHLSTRLLAFVTIARRACGLLWLGILRRCAGSTLQVRLICTAMVDEVQVMPR